MKHNLRPSQSSKQKNTRKRHMINRYELTKANIKEYFYCLQKEINKIGNFMCKEYFTF